MPMKKTLTALVSLSLLPLSALALDVVAPHPGTVTATTYYSSGTFHGAVDMASGKACGSTPLYAPIKGMLWWNVTIRNTSRICYGGSTGGNPNEAKHTFATGYTFRVWHFFKTAASVDKTGNQCELGDEGATGISTAPHTHMHYEKSGTNNTSWYSGTTKGEYLDQGEVIGRI